MHDREVGVVPSPGTGTGRPRSHDPSRPARLPRLATSRPFCHADLPPRAALRTLRVRIAGARRLDRVLRAAGGAVARAADRGPPRLDTGAEIDLVIAVVWAAFSIAIAAWHGRVRAIARERARRRSRSTSRRWSSPRSSIRSSRGGHAVDRRHAAAHSVLGVLVYYVDFDIVSYVAVVAVAEALLVRRALLARSATGEATRDLVGPRAARLSRGAAPAALSVQLARRGVRVRLRRARDGQPRAAAAHRDLPHRARPQERRGHARRGDRRHRAVSRHSANSLRRLAHDRVSRRRCRRRLPAAAVRSSAARRERHSPRAERAERGGHDRHLGRRSNTACSSCACRTMASGSRGRRRRPAAASGSPTFAIVWRSSTATTNASGSSNSAAGGDDRRADDSRAQATAMRARDRDADARACRIGDTTPRALRVPPPFAASGIAIRRDGSCGDWCGHSRASSTHVAPPPRRRDLVRRSRGTTWRRRSSGRCSRRSSLALAKPLPIRADRPRDRRRGVRSSRARSRRSRTSRWSSDLTERTGPLRPDWQPTVVLDFVIFFALAAIAHRGVLLEWLRAREAASASLTAEVAAAQARAAQLQLDSAGAPALARRHRRDRPPRSIAHRTTAHATRPTTCVSRSSAPTSAASHRSASEHSSPPSRRSATAERIRCVTLTPDVRDMLTVIVADDEKIARRRLVRLIEETGEAEVVAACAGGRDAVAQTLELSPQLLFLDVQMPDLDGFGVLREIAGGRAGDGLRHGVRPVRGPRVRRPRRGLSAQAVRHRAVSRRVRARQGARSTARARALTMNAFARSSPTTWRRRRRRRANRWTASP